MAELGEGPRRVTISGVGDRKRNKNTKGVGGPPATPPSTRQDPPDGSNHHARIARIGMWTGIAAVVVAVGVPAWQHISNAEQGEKTTKAAESIKQALDAQALPQVKFFKYQWYGTDLACDRPAQGVFLYVKNMSSVPVRLDWFQSGVRIGGEPFRHKDPRAVGSPDIGPYLAPGEATANAVIDENFKAVFASMRGEATYPPIEFWISTKYSTLANRRCFEYTISLDLHTHCSIPLQRQHRVMSERFKEVECQAP